MARLVDTSGALDAFRRWQGEDGRDASRGGRPAYISERTLLILLLLLAESGKPLFLTRAAAMVCVACTDGALEELGLPTRKRSRATRDDYRLNYKNWYHRIQSAWKRLNKVMDPYPEITYGRRLTCGEYDELTKDCDEAFIQARRARATEFWNRILVASRDLLPEEARALYKGTHCRRRNKTRSLPKRQPYRRSTHT